MLWALLHIHLQGFIEADVVTLESSAQRSIQQGMTLHQVGFRANHNRFRPKQMPNVA